MTVGDLRKLIEGMPDSAPISPEFMGTVNDEPDRVEIRRVDLGNGPPFLVVRIAYDQPPGGREESMEISVFGRDGHWRVIATSDPVGVVHEAMEVSQHQSFLIIFADGERCRFDSASYRIRPVAPTTETSTGWERLAKLLNRREGK